MTKLNQILAIEAGAKRDAETATTWAHHNFAKPALLAGISRVYRPRDDEGDQLPPESTKVQLQAEQVIKTVGEKLARLFDVTAIKDYTNCTARASIVVDGETLIEDAPVSYLLFLEKQLVNLLTFITKLPFQDPAETWEQDPTSGLWRTPEVVTVRSKKVPRNHVKAEATDRHPAQVEVWHEDIPVGYWHTVKFTGALPIKRIGELRERVTKLQAAVKMAREEANSVTVTDVRPGERIIDYLFR